MDLLRINDRKEPEKTHYVWIKDLARMLYKNSNHKERKHPCRRCLHIFSTEKLLEDHKNDCQGIDGKGSRIAPSCQKRERTSWSLSTIASRCVHPSLSTLTLKR